MEQRQQLEPVWEPEEKQEIVHVDDGEGGREGEGTEEQQKAGESHQIEGQLKSGVSER